MAWPKGKPRKAMTDAAPAVASPTIGAPPPPAALKPRALMKARPNWNDTSAIESDSPDRLHIPRDLFPEGYDFQWVTVSVLGMEVPEHTAKFERRGWTMVHGQDFDGIFDGKFLSKGSDGPIVVDGLALMARPLELSLKAKRAELAAAREAVMIKQQQLTGGDLPGVSLDSRHPTAVASNRINRTIEPVQIPRDGDYSE
jgi:hypothetical protein